MRSFSANPQWRFLLLTSALLITGCATGSHSTNEQVYSSTSQRPAPITTVRPQQTGQHTSPGHALPPPGAPALPAGPATPSTPENPGVAALLQQAAQSRASGDFARAQTLAERAQGLAPHDAHSYLELSRIYHARGDHARSRQMALRGMSVSDGDPELDYELQLLSAP